MRTRRPALRGQTGDPIRARASAPERGRGGGHGRSPSFSMRRLRRWTGAGETGKGPGRGGPRKRDTLGRGPREQQTGSGLRRTEKRRGAPTGCGHARPTPRNRRRRWGGRAPPRGEWIKATRGTRVGRQGPPRDLTSRGLPAQGRSSGTPGTTDWRPHPPHGARCHHHRHTQSRSLPGRTLSHRIAAAPTVLTRAKLSAPPPFSGLRGHCSARGRHRPLGATPT